MRVSRRGMNGGMNDMNGGMNEGRSVTTRHPPRRARHLRRAPRPRLNKRVAPERANGLLANCARELRSKFAGSCGT
jgi:hypothetical protein